MIKAIAIFLGVLAVLLVGAIFLLIAVSAPHAPGPGFISDDKGGDGGAARWRDVRRLR